jgi:hypothetical protein
MPLRVIAFFLAVVLLWSGLATVETPRALAQPSPEQPHAFVHSSGQTAVQEGSVEHHHLDDLPSQVQSVALVESPDLPALPIVFGIPAVVIPMVHPRALTPTGLASPWLAGLLRPPSCTVRIG